MWQRGRENGGVEEQRARSIERTQAREREGDGVGERRRVGVKLRKIWESRVGERKKGKRGDQRRRGGA
eukprot:6033290-Pleurochrysis_carterae.AAC.4